MTTSAENRLGVILLLLLSGLILLPLARLVMQALWPPEGGTSSAVWLSAQTWQAVWHSVVVSVGGTLLALPLGGAYAVLVGVSNLRGKAALVFVLLLPLMIPPQITAMSWAQLLGPGSPVLGAVGLAPAPGSPNPMYSAWGIAALLGLQQVPLIFLALRPLVRALPRELFEAAAASGATPARQVRDMLLPLLAPGLLAAASLSFVSCLDNFGIPALLGAPVNYTVLSTLIYQRLSGFGIGVLAEVAQLSLLSAALALAGLGAHALLQRRWQARISGASAPLRVNLGRWSGLVQSLAWGLPVVSLLLPTLALLGTSLVTAYGLPLGPRTFTFDHYLHLGADPMVRQGLANSLWLSAWTALIGGALALPAAYLLVWHRQSAIRWLGALADLPYALPGAVVAIAAILVWLKPLPGLGVSLYGTLWIILYAYLVRFLTLSFKPVVAVYSRLDPALDEAARGCGAGLAMRLRTLAWPLAAPALISGGLLVFLMAVNELTVSSLLWSSGTQTLGVLIYNFEEGGSVEAAAALSVLTIAGLLAVLATLQWAARRVPRLALPWQE